MQDINTINIKALKSPLDASTDSMLRFKQGDDISFRVAIFKDNETLASLENIVDLRFEIYDIGNYQSPTPRSFEILLQKIVELENINTTLSLDDWDNEDSQHVIFEIGAEESGLDYGEKWLKISAQLENQKLVTLSAGWIEVEENFSIYESPAPVDIQEWKNTALVASENAKTYAEQAQAAATSAKESEESALSSANAASGANEYAESASASASSASESALSAASSAEGIFAQAEIATTQAGLASGYAESAESSATSATTSASTATSQATSAATSASTATTQASNASASATSASSSATSASTSASTATTQATNASTSATSASSSASAASASATAAATSASEAAASANTVASGVSALSQITQKKGEIYFPYGTRANANGVLSSTYYPITLCMRYKHDTSLNANSVIFGIGNSSSVTSGMSFTWVSSNYLQLRAFFSYNSHIAAYWTGTASSTIKDGNYHDIVLIYRGLSYDESTAKYTPDCSLYVDGTFYANSSKDTNSNTTSLDSSYNVYICSTNGAILANGSTSLSMSDYMIFNCELPLNDEADTDGIGYTIEDYSNGLDVPIALQNQSADKHCAFWLDNYTYTVGSTHYIPAILGPKATCTDSTTYGNVQGTQDNQIKALSDLIIANT